MRQLLYVSALARGVAPVVIPEVLDKSRSNNARDGLTGLLLFTGSSFLQILEGAEDTVERAVARIGQDPRHSRLMVLLDRTVAERSFADWTMGYRVVGEQIERDGITFRLTREALAERVAAGDDESLHTLLQAFCDVELIDT